MMRTKVVNDSTDLIPLLRAFDNKTKKEVFKEILVDWKPYSEIKEKYGKEGIKALDQFDKMKLVETKWTTSEDGIDGRPQKKYKSYSQNSISFNAVSRSLLFKRFHCSCAKSAK